MRIKLTLRLEEELIRKAKRVSKRSGKSVSGMVADYFENLEATPSGEIEGTTPKVAALRGILKNTRAEEADYSSHLEGKYL